MVLSARDLGRAGRHSTTPEQAWATLREFPRFVAQQKQVEILAALRHLQARQPERILEIGAAGGGTSFLLSRVAASSSVVVSVDLELGVALELAMRAWARPKQRTLGLRRDSHSTETAREVAAMMGAPLDVLFIDGDHSYQGVKADFLLYSPMVRPGGVIAFHDIIPDNTSRGRPQSLAWSGGVPDFWSRLKTKFGGTEYVEDLEQDGYGIGIVDWPGVLAAEAAVGSLATGLDS